MNREIFYQISIFCLMVFSGCSHTAKTEKPNFLFILADDLGWADPGFMGSKYHKTPNLNELASEGMVFTDAYAACPVCSPSRAAIMSGKYPARLNLTDYIPGNRSYGPHKDQKLASKPFELQLGLEETTMAEALKTGGYKTFFAGKWHLGSQEKYFPRHQGFDINIGGNGTGTPKGGYFSPYQNPQIPDGPVGEYLTDRLTDEAIRFMDKNEEFPFLIYLSFHTVHMPLQGKPEKVERYRKKLGGMEYEGDSLTKCGKIYIKHHQNTPHFAAMAESMDENIGRLLDMLSNLKLEKNTVVIFTSDNGGMSTRDTPSVIPTSNAPLRMGKGYLYEGGIRVPLIVRWTGKIKPGGKCNIPVTGTDFYPTILELAGLELLSEQHKDGISLKPLLLKGEKPEREAIYWHYPHYSGGLGGRPSAAIRKGDYKLIEFFEDRHVELYNLSEDIGETIDLSSEFPEVTEELKARLHTWYKEVNALMPYQNPYYTGAGE